MTAWVVLVAALKPFVVAALAPANKMAIRQAVNRAATY
jgi:hypothetical protein